MAYKKESFDSGRWQSENTTKSKKKAKVFFIGIVLVTSISIDTYKYISTRTSAKENPKIELQKKIKEAKGDTDSIYSKEQKIYVTPDSNKLNDEIKSQGIQAGVRPVYNEKNNTNIDESLKRFIVKDFNEIDKKPLQLIIFYVEGAGSNTHINETMRELVLDDSFDTKMSLVPVNDNNAKEYSLFMQSNGYSASLVQNRPSCKRLHFLLYYFL
ncbi:hypothetical protein [Floricoccus penangensis]|uniref:hypothetical protein n=1 Tax=Floricoccus penangensis TaxID=1859475 RepID=UPI00203C857E|nr:hypothetical protein [Floricoccus penangensis]URZ86809.1 hypothetical protein KIW23_06890 [Floricoccus penangensis]